MASRSELTPERFKPVTKAIAVIPKKIRRPAMGHAGRQFSCAWLTGRQRAAALAFNDYNLQVKKHAYRGLCAPAESGDSWRRQNDANLAIRN
jgi:hypothetical protein